MKVLVAEDNRQKVQRLIDLLVTQCALPRDNVDVEETIYGARARLKSQYYDLLILDIVLPVRAEDDPSQKGAIELIEELSVRNTLQRPGRIIGLTAYDEAVKDVAPLFATRVWTLIKYDFETDDWATQIGNCVRYIQAQTTQPRKLTYKSDVCIITALSVPEMEAISRNGWAWSAAEPIDDTTFLRRGTFHSGGKEYTAVASIAPRMGMVASALLAAKLIERERPRFLVIAGICAGVSGKTNFGDIILGDPSWDWQNGKHVATALGHEFAIAPDQLSIASFVRVRGELLRGDGALWSEVRNRWPSPPETELKFRMGPMASGSAVLADEDLLEKIIQQHRSLLAVDMEAYGVYAAAAAACYPRPTALALKSVCDFATAEKDDKWQTYAAYTSATCVRLFFEKYMNEIANLAGTV